MSFQEKDNLFLKAIEHRASFPEKSEVVKIEQNELTVQLSETRMRMLESERSWLTSQASEE